MVHKKINLPKKIALCATSPLHGVKNGNAIGKTLFIAQSAANLQSDLIF